MTRRRRRRWGKRYPPRARREGLELARMWAGLRGKDLAWIKIHEYKTILDYLSSDIFKELTNGNYSLRKSRETNYGDR
jgi:hypothetical protein